MKEDTVYMRSFVFRVLTYRLTTTIIHCKLKWHHFQTPVCRCISWKMRTCSNASLFSMMKKKSCLTTTDCVQYSFAKVPSKPLRNSDGRRTLFIVVAG